MENSGNDIREYAGRTERPKSALEQLAELVSRAEERAKTVSNASGSGSSGVPHLSE